MGLVLDSVWSDAEAQQNRCGGSFATRPAALRIRIYNTDTFSRNVVAYAGGGSCRSDPWDVPPGGGIDFYVPYANCAGPTATDNVCYAVDTASGDVSNACHIAVPAVAHAACVGGVCQQVSGPGVDECPIFGQPCGQPPPQPPPPVQPPPVTPPGGHPPPGAPPPGGQPPPPPGTCTGFVLGQQCVPLEAVVVGVAAVAVAGLVATGNLRFGGGQQ